MVSRDDPKNMPVGQKDIIGIVLTDWHWEIKDTIFEKYIGKKN